MEIRIAASRVQSLQSPPDNFTPSWSSHQCSPARLSLKEVSQLLLNLPSSLCWGLLLTPGPQTHSSAVDLLTCHCHATPVQGQHGAPWTLFFHQGNYPVVPQLQPQWKFQDRVSPPRTQPLPAAPPPLHPQSIPNTGVLARPPLPHAQDPPALTLSCGPTEVSCDSCCHFCPPCDVPGLPASFSPLGSEVSLWTAPAPPSPSWSRTLCPRRPLLLISLLATHPHAPPVPGFSSV